MQNLHCVVAVLATLVVDHRCGMSMSMQGLQSNGQPEQPSLRKSGQNRKEQKRGEDIATFGLGRPEGPAKPER